MKKLFAVIALLFIGGLTVAQNLPAISAEIRPRFNIDNRDFNSNTKSHSYTEMRSRLGADFNAFENLNMFVQVQDSRIWGTEPSTLTNTSNVDLHQAYFQLSDFFKLPLDLKVGRMEVKYGPERLIGAVGWSNVGRSFDGAILKYKRNNFTIDFFALKEAESMQLNDTLDASVYGAYSNVKVGESYSIQPFVIYYNSEKASYPFENITAGLYVTGKSGGFFHETEFAYQTGKRKDNVDLKLNALMAALNLGYNFDAKVKPYVKAGVDYLSGDNDPTDNKVKVFNTLFATNHKYYGYMDYFINIPADTYGLGLMDIHASVGLTPFENFGIDVKGHLFNSAEDFVLINGSTTKSFGTEIDITLKYKYNKAVGFEAGLGFFSPGDIFKETRGPDSSTWFYLMSVVAL
ncbi:MAG: hypothetical protein CMF23_04755 [Ignavibacteriae bacterium]|nr:hypothetical protein [Ignavibacteriota bacterium]